MNRLYRNKLTGEYIYASLPTGVEESTWVRNLRAQGLVHTGRGDSFTTIHSSICREPGKNSVYVSSYITLHQDGKVGVLDNLTDSYELVPEPHYKLAVVRQQLFPKHIPYYDVNKMVLVDAEYHATHTVTVEYGTIEVHNLETHQTLEYTDKLPVTYGSPKEKDVIKLGEDWVTVKEVVGAYVVVGTPKGNTAMLKWGGLDVWRYLPPPKPPLYEVKVNKKEDEGDC